MYLVLCAEVEGGVDPAVVVQHLAAHPGGRLAVDRVPKVLQTYMSVYGLQRAVDLFCDAEEAGPHQDGDGDTVVQFEHNVVDRQVVEFEESLG